MDPLKKKSRSNTCFVCRKYRRTGQKITLFSFPNFQMYPKLLMLWLQTLNVDYEVTVSMSLKVCSDHFLEKEITIKNHVKKLIPGAVPSLIPSEFPKTHDYEKFNLDSYSEILRKLDSDFEEKKKQVISNVVPDRMFVVDPQTIDISAYPNDAEGSMTFSDTESDDEESMKQEFSSEEEDDEIYEQTEEYEPNLNLSLRK